MLKNKNSKQKHISVLRKIGYGSGNITYSLPYQAFASFFIFYATVILKIPAAYAGLIMAISAVWDALTDPVMGLISDNTSSRKYGRRHQYILLGTAAISGLSYLLWNIQPETELAVKMLLLLFSVISLRTALTVFAAPYIALGAELSADYDERSSIQAYRAFFYIIGMILAIVGSTIFFFRSTPEYARGQLNPAAYPQMGFAISVIALLAGVVVFYTTKKYIQRLPQRTRNLQPQKSSLRRLYSDLVGSLKNKDFLMLGLTIFTLEIGFQFGIAIGFHINTYTYQLTGPQIGMLGLTLLSVSVITQPFWVWFSKKFDKKTAVYFGLMLFFSGFIGAPWTHVWWEIFPINPATIIYTLAGFNILAGAGNGALMSIPFSMVADTIDFEELKTGKRDQGLYFGMFTLAYKLGTSISIFASGFMLTLIGFNPESDIQSPAAVFNLAMVPTYLLLAVFPFSIYFISKYSINRKKYQELQEKKDKFQ